MTSLTPERRAELREYATEWLDVSAVNIFPDVLLALLDAADVLEAVLKVSMPRTTPAYAWESMDGWSDGYDQAMEDVRAVLRIPDDSRN